MRNVLKCILGILLFVAFVSACSLKADADRSKDNIPSMTIHANTFLPSTCENSDKSILPVDKELQSTHILYQGYDTELNQSQLWVVRLKDGNRWQLKDYPTSASGIGFLKDGQNFLIATGIGNKTWLGNINGSPPSKVSITDRLMADFTPYSLLWNEFQNDKPEALDYLKGRIHSPDGKNIAIWQPGNDALVILNTANQKQVEIIKTDSNDIIDGEWTRDGYRFVFVYERESGNESYSQILMTNVDGTDIRALTVPITASLFSKPEISPDGKKVVFEVLRMRDMPGNGIGVLDIGNKKLNIYSIDPLLLSESLISQTFVWSPDSKWVAFFTWLDIRAMDIQTGKIYCAVYDKLHKQLMDWR